MGVVDFPASAGEPLLLLLIVQLVDVGIAIPAKEDAPIGRAGDYGDGTVPPLDRHLGLVKGNGLIPRRGGNRGDTEQDNLCDVRNHEDMGDGLHKHARFRRDQGHGGDVVRRFFVADNLGIGMCSPREKGNRRLRPRHG